MKHIRLSKKQLEQLQALAAAYREDRGLWVWMPLRVETERRFVDAGWVVKSAREAQCYRLTAEGYKAAMRRRQARTRRRYSDEQLGEVARLFFDEGLSYDEIGQRLGMHPNYVGFVVRGDTQQATRVLAERGYKPHIGARVRNREMAAHVCRLRRAGHTYEQIEALTSLPFATVARICQREIGLVYESVSAEEAAVMYDLVQSGRTMRDVAQDLGRSWHTVYRHWQAERLRREMQARARYARQEAGD